MDNAIYREANDFSLYLTDIRCRKYWNFYNLVQTIPAVYGTFSKLLWSCVFFYFIVLSPNILEDFIQIMRIRKHTHARVGAT